MPLIVNMSLPSPRRQVEGVALVLVLWMLVLLTVIANSLVFSSRTELQTIANSVSIAHAEALADAGVYMAIHQLSSASTTQLTQVEPGRWKPDGLLRRWRYQDAELQVAIIDESGKIDINAAPQTLLADFFAASWVDRPTAEALGDAMLDWRDPDDLRHLHGAEKEEYALAGRDYIPANADFETIDELRQVLGMSGNLFSRIEPFISVHSRQAGINTAVAPREVLLSLPGVTAEQVDLFVTQRQALLEQGLPPAPFPAASGIVAPATATTYNIQVEVVLSNNTKFVRQAVVRLTGDPAEPVAVLVWRAPAGGGVKLGSDSGIVKSNG